MTLKGKTWQAACCSDASRKHSRQEEEANADAKKEISVAKEEVDSIPLIPNFMQ